MPALIASLIDKVDNSELVRDQIAAIMVLEIAAQQALATAGGKDSRLWALRVFSERSNPWNEFQDQPEDPLDVAPIVNIWFDRATFDQHAGNVVERQQATGTFHLDCYGYGLSEDVPAGGHVAGDCKAALEAQRAVRLVRNILMSSHYTYLGLRDLVGKRWPSSISTFQVPIEKSTTQHVAAARLALDVGYNEFSPQVTGSIMDTVHATVRRAETGEVFLTAQF